MGDFTGLQNLEKHIPICRLLRSASHRPHTPKKKNRATESSDEEERPPEPRKATKKQQKT
jgi:hypothetical protein